MVIACGLSAIFGGAVSGLAVTRLGAEPQAQPARAKKASPDGAAELERRLAQLEGQLSTLRRQQQARTQLRKYAEALQEDVDDAADQAPPKGNTPISGVVDGEDPVFEMAVRSVMDRVDWEKDEERKTARANRSAERAQRQTELLTQRLSLDSQQSAAVAAALGQQMERFRALRDADDDSEPRPVTREEWRQRIGDIRQQTEATLTKLLSEEQMRRYVEIAEEEGIGTRGFGGGRRGERGQGNAPGGRATPPSSAER